MMTRTHVSACVVALLGLPGTPARADETQSTIMAPVGTMVLQVHAVGAQLYDCKPGPNGALVWTFREPIASLLSAGKTVGRHFAGPAWEIADGSRIVGTVLAKAAGTSPGDIPWLKLTVSARQGDGLLTPVTMVQRIDTVGGNKTGACAKAGDIVAEPYAADYVFSRP